jgi:hypothetical protein
MIARESRTLFLLFLVPSLLFYIAACYYGVEGWFFLRNARRYEATVSGSPDPVDYDMSSDAVIVTFRNERGAFVTSHVDAPLSRPPRGEVRAVACRTTQPPDCRLANLFAASSPAPYLLLIALVLFPGAPLLGMLALRYL